MVRVGFCLVHKSPNHVEMGQAVLNLSDDDTTTHNLRSNLLQGVHLQPRRNHPISDAVEDLVVGLEARGDEGFYSNFLYTTSFREAVPEFLIMGEIDSPIFSLVERLRLVYGGNTRIGPWPNYMGRGKGPVEIKNLPQGIDTDLNISLDDMTYMDKCTFQKKAFLMSEFEKLSTVVIPENKLLRRTMLKHRSLLPRYEDTPACSTSGSQSSIVTTTYSPRPLSQLQVTDPDPESVAETNNTTELPMPVKTKSCFSCPLCNYKSKNNSNVHKHIKTHFKEKKLLKCDKCHISMTDPSNFKMHMKRHANKNVCACDICGKKFVAKSNLLKHKECHERGMVKYTGRCALPRCKQYKKEFKHLLLHTSKAHGLYSLEDYKNAILLEHQEIQSGGHECSCPNHQRWIQKIIGSGHNCYLCDCLFTWQRGPTIHNGIMIWKRWCKYALHVTPELVKNSKLHY